VSALQLLDDVRVAGGSQERWQPVMVLDDLVRRDPSRNFAGPADQLRDAEGTFPIRVFLAAKR
jgi:hypothetical protein